MIYETRTAMREDKIDIVRNFLRFYGADMKDAADSLQGHPTTKDLNEATSLLLKAHDLLAELVQ